MKYIEAPNLTIDVVNMPTVFMAGGITDCPDWQQDMVKLLSGTEYLLANPRRKDFPIDDPSAAEEQIKWEYCWLQWSDAIMFWFPKETLCPIVLYELGAWSKTDKPIAVGVHPDYKRRQDVEIQTKLARPGVEIVYSLTELADIFVEDEDVLRDRA